MKKSAFISDVLFAFSGVGLFSLCLFRFLKIPLAVCVLLGIICGALAACSVAAYLQNRRTRFFLKKSDERQKERLLTHLALLSPKQATAFFMPVLQTELETPRIFACGKLITETDFYFLHVHFLPVTADEVAAYARWKTDKKKTILCRDIEKEAAELCQKLEISIIPANEIYRMVKEKNAFPEHYLGEQKAAEKKKKRFQLCFAKTNARRFLTGGALILFTSLFTPFPYYYLVFGSLLCVTALLVRIFGHA